jgi:hypothetical protein
MSALMLSNAFGKVTAKGMPPVSVTCFKKKSLLAQWSFLMPLSQRL